MAGRHSPHITSPSTRPPGEATLVPIAIPELPRLLRDVMIPPPCRDLARQHWNALYQRHALIKN
jgi:hypothetical protein